MSALVSHAEAQQIRQKVIFNGPLHADDVARLCETVIHLTRALDEASAARNELREVLAVADQMHYRLLADRDDASERADRAEARIQAMREMHSPREHRPMDGMSLGGLVCDACRRNYPCPTIRALDGEVGA